MIKVNVHPYPTRVWFTTNKDEYSDKCFILTGGRPNLSARGICSTDGCGRVVVGVFDDSTSTLAHELIHVAIRVFHHIGMETCYQTEEALCYLVQSMHEQCIKQMNKERAREQS